MYAQQELHQARNARAQYYLKQLQIASTLYREGGLRARQSLVKFEQDWGQIEQGQSWTAGRLEDECAARLCCQFPTVGAELLTLRLSVSDQTRWLKPALAAAQQLGESQAECDRLCHLSQAYWSAEITLGYQTGARIGSFASAGGTWNDCLIVAVPLDATQRGNRTPWNVATSTRPGHRYTSPARNGSDSTSCPRIAQALISIVQMRP